MSLFFIIDMKIEVILYNNHLLIPTLIFHISSFTFFSFIIFYFCFSLITKYQPNMLMRIASIPKHNNTGDVILENAN